MTQTDNELEFKNRTSFSGMLPSVTAGARFGVTMEPIATGAIATAAVAGIVPVRVAVGSDTYACAEPMPGTSVLQCVPHGPSTLLWIEPAGVIRWAIIRFDQTNYEEIVYITSNVADEDGYYPAIVQRYDTFSRTWISQYTCKVIDANR